MHHLPPRPGLMLGVPHCEECLDGAAFYEVVVDGPSDEGHYLACHGCAAAAQSSRATLAYVPFPSRN